MNTKVLGAYLQILRVGRGLTQTEIADMLGVSLRQVRNWEKGNSDPSATALLFFTHLVNGNLDQIEYLVCTPGLTVEDGQRLAQEWLNRKPASDHPIEPEPFRIFGSIFTATVRDLQELVPLYVPGERKNHTYRGKRHNLKGGGCLVTVDGQSLYTYLGWQETSGVDFEWGYSGRGPSLLATAILTCECDRTTAEQYGMGFMADIVSILPREKGGVEWVLQSEQVLLWLTLRKIVEREREQARATDMTPAK